jgi:hypothetical protein
MNRVFSLGNDSIFADAVTGVGKGLYTGADLLGKGVNGTIGAVQSIPGAISGTASTLDSYASPLYGSSFCLKYPNSKSCSGGSRKNKKRKNARKTRYAKKSKKNKTSKKR